MIWGGTYCTYGGRSGAYRIFNGEPEGKKPFGRIRHSVSTVLEWLLKRGF
jgi:hypothetical protein